MSFHFFTNKQKEVTDWLLKVVKLKTCLLYTIDLRLWEIELLTAGFLDRFRNTET